MNGDRVYGLTILTPAENLDPPLQFQPWNWSKRFFWLRRAGLGANALKHVQPTDN